MSTDNWQHRGSNMRCATCMWFVEKGGRQVTPDDPLAQHPHFGRCRRHAPTMDGFPAVYAGDFCGDHKLDEANA